MPPPTALKKRMHAASTKSAQIRAEQRAREDENTLPYGRSQRRVLQLANDLAVSEQQRKNAEDTARIVLRQVQNTQHANNRNKRLVETLRAEVNDLCARVDPTIATQLEQTRAELKHKEVDNNRLRDEKNRLAVQRNRAVASLAKCIPEKEAHRRVSSALVAHFKAKGIVREPIREAIRDLYCKFGISYRNVYPTMVVVCNAVGMKVADSFSHTTVSNCIKEALAASQLQVCGLIMKGRSTYHAP